MDNSDEPAFSLQGTDRHPSYPGLTIREWFAGMAMAAMLNTELRREQMATPVNIARDSIKMAEALIAELAKARKP
jgi:metal-dependent amidase/aminoacylase/carboxypeptidase family protein